MAAWQDFFLSGWSGSTPVTGTGAVTAESASVSSNGIEAFRGTGAVTADSASATAQGKEAFTGTGSATADAATLAVTGAEAFPATGAVTAEQATVTATGALRIIGNTGGSSEPASVAGEGSVQEAGAAVTGYGGVAYVTHLDELVTFQDEGVWEGESGAITARAATVAATGRSAFTGAGDASARSATVAAEGSVTAPAEELPNLQAAGPRLERKPTIQITGTASVTVKSATVQAFGAVNDDDLVLLLAA